jgi:DNA-binding CsgD family transcriptional regulator
VAISASWLDASDRAANEGVFVGRQSELDAVASVVELAAHGRSQVVWIEGPAGTGKTALLRRIVANLDARFSVVWGEADELSMDASLSLLTQYAAVEAASAFAAGLQLIEQLGATYHTGAVAIVAEDLHWADVASRGALLTVARRLRHDHVLMLVTARPGTRFDDWDRFVLDPEHCLRIVLAGLDDDDVGELAERHGVTLSPSQAGRLRRHTDGHALHVRTLLQELTPAQLQSTAGDLPAPRTLAAVTLATLGALSPDARALAAGLAVLGVRMPLAVVGSVAGVERPTEALEALLGTGLVRWAPAADGTPVEFTHPLYRTAVYDDLAPGRRRDLHLASAQVTRWGTSWAHRVAATDSTDDVLADELERGAHYEIARGELSVAATYLSWAATLSSSREQSEERLLLGARLLIVDGQTSRAAALFPRIEGCAETGLRDLVLGMLAFSQADPGAGERWLTSSTRLPGPTWIRADAYGHLTSLYSLQGRGEAVVAAAEAALALGAFEQTATEHNVWWGYAVGVAMRDGGPAGLAILERRLSAPPTEVDAEDADLLGVRGMLRCYAGLTTQGIADLRAAIGMSRTGASYRQLPRAHLALARGLVVAGAWDEAQVQARTMQSLLDEHHVWMGAQAEAVVVPILAARGDFAQAEANAAAADAAMAALGTIEIEGMARLGRAAIARAKGDARGVIAALAPIQEGVAFRSGAKTSVLSWWPMLVTAFIEAGDLDEAAAQLPRFVTIATEGGFLHVAAHEAELRGRLAVARGEPEEAAAWFERAVAGLSDDHPALERALLHHAYGRLLRAHGTRRPAHDQLRTAHELLERLGAEVYLRAVAEDLAAWTGREGQRTKRSPLTLTTREQDVVALVNKGFTNKEVGAQLYISAKAVEYHLGNVYGKLGVRSRRELRDALPTS